ncbi:hypothetical protein D3C80_1450710 [compost metagenome]
MAVENNGSNALTRIAADPLVEMGCRARMARMNRPAIFPGREGALVRFPGFSGQILNRVLPTEGGGKTVHFVGFSGGSGTVVRQCRVGQTLLIKEAVFALV